jgi:hypothetical protein
MTRKNILLRGLTLKGAHAVPLSGAAQADQFGVQVAARAFLPTSH